jgi:hypothetical protein
MVQDLLKKSKEDAGSFDCLKLQFFNLVFRQMHRFFEVLIIIGKLETIGTRNRRFYQPSVVVNSKTLPRFHIEFNYANVHLSIGFANSFETYSLELIFPGVLKSNKMREFEVDGSRT